MILTITGERDQYWMREGQFELYLEAYIDKRGLPNLLNKLSIICAEKAYHVEESYQDAATASTWHAKATLIGDLADKLYESESEGAPQS